MFIRDAKRIADELKLLMSPFCQRIEIAGSIRRGCQVVKDIELVATPKWDTRPGAGLPLFGGEPEERNLLHEWARRETGADGGLRNWLRWIKPGTKEVIPWEPKPEGKYWRGLVQGEVKLDLFLAKQQNFGLIYLIRTGSATFSQGVMSYAKLKTKYQVYGGHIVHFSDGTQIVTPEEKQAFDVLGLDYIEPTDRSGAHMVRVAGQAQFPVGWGDEWARRVGK